MSRPVTVEYDLARLEALAAAGYSQTQAAAEMGVSSGTFNHHLNGAGRPEVRHAWNAGRRRLEADIPPAPASPAERHRREDEVVLACLREHGEQTRPEMRERTGLDYDPLNDALDRLTIPGLVRKDGRGMFDRYSLAPQPARETVKKGRRWEARSL